MAIVKLFGLFQRLSDKTQFEIDEKDVANALKTLAKQIEVPYSELKNGVLFVNKTPVEKLKGLKTPLSKTDELAILSPASGG